MKISTVLLLFSQIVLGQTIYNFDYQVEYKKVLNDSTKVNYSNQLVNSKNNNYSLNCYIKDSTFSKLFFSDYKVLFFELETNTDKFKENNLLNISCDNIFKHTSTLGSKTDEYDFEKLNDTVINNNTFYHYILKSNKSVKYQKRKKISVAHYIITKSNPEFEPLFNHPIELAKWKENPMVQNGILIMKYYTNWKKEITTKIILDKITSIDKNIIIPEDCVIEIKKGNLILLIR